MFIFHSTKEYEDLNQAVATLIGSPSDTSPDRLAMSLLSAWGEQQIEISDLKTELENVTWDRDYAQNTVTVRKKKSIDDNRNNNDFRWISLNKII